MFSGGGKRRPIPSYNRPPPTVPVKSTTTTATAPTPSSSVATRLGPPVVSKQQQPPPSSSSPNKAATQNKFTTTTTKVVVKKVIQPAPVVPPPKSNGGGPRSVNKYKPPTPPPAAPPAPEPTSSRKGKGKQRYDKDEEDHHVRRAGGSPPKKRARRPSPPSSAVDARPARADSSSDLDPLTPSEEEEDESDLSSADEEWASKIFRREEGAPVAVRDVAYKPGAEEGSEGTSEAAVASLTSAESLVLQNPTAYRSHFIDPANPDRPVAEWAGNDIPTIELEYPGDGGRERFALLAPRSDDEYNPIEDVMAVILIVLDHFLTPDQASHHFGHAPGKTAFAAFLYNRTGSSSASNSRAGTPSSGLAGAPKDDGSRANGEVAAAAAAAPPNGEPASVLPGGETGGFRIEPSDSSEPLIRQLEKARSKADGPAFLAALTRYNLTLSHLKHLGVVRANIATMKGLREKVWTRVFTQCYDRAVGPTLEDVKKYRAFSDNVYGELLPKFMNEIFAKTHLGPNSVFVDLGSGVGNCVVQAALATGAESWGFENMPHASLLARAQVVEANERFKLWGLSGGEMQVREADFCEDPEVGAVLRRADVVLVNNEVFTSALNERLSWLFLELPPGAKIVSLKPFLPPSFKLSSHNAGSPLAILSQYPPARYTHNCVSWKPEGGTYFVARIDRTRLMRFQDKERERERKRERQQRERRARREGSSAAGSSSGMSRTGSTASIATPSAGTPHGMSRTASRQGSNLAR